MRSVLTIGHGGVSAVSIPAAPPAMRLVLPLPPLVNRYWRSVIIRKAVRVLLSAEARKYHQLVARELAGVETIDCPVIVGVTVFVARRGTDADAVTKGLFDTLQKTGVLADDNLICAYAVTRFYDRENPRVELQIVRATDPALIDAIAPSKLVASTP